MVEPTWKKWLCSGRRPSGRRTAQLIALILVGASTLLPPAASLAAEPAAPAPVVPSAFQLQGTNGYSIFVFAVPARGGLPGSVQVIARKGHMSVRYSAPATVTETSITADLGSLGQIAVDFHAGSPPITKSFKCAGQKVAAVMGSYEGVIAFHGEEGYTSAEAAAVPADFPLELAEACNFAVSGGGGSPNLRSAELYVRNPGLGPRFSVFKATPRSPARFFVEASEYNAGISIERVASLVMAPASFRYGANLQTAIVRPPAPFSGAAHFDRRKKANRRWSGDLSVDLPGLADAPLTGPLLRAGLVHVG
jgi:hypothetical protein